MPRKRSDGASDLPDPPIPADADLRKFPYMPLDIARLLTSETWLLGNGDQCKAAITLWCVAFHQVPAGSLPKDERMLAMLSRYEGKWSDVREHAMRGWYECGDGRLYHPVVNEKALEAWNSRLMFRESGRAGAAKRWAKNSPPIAPPKGGHRGANGLPIATDTETDTETDKRRKRHGSRPENLNLNHSSRTRAREPDSESKNSEVRDPVDATRIGANVIERQGAWLTLASAELRRRLPAEVAEPIIAGALAGRANAKATLEKYWRSRTKRGKV
jgi:hypothetical protein